MLHVRFRSFHLLSSLLVALTGSAYAQSTITSLSRTSAPHSGRVVIRGAGFGERDTGGYVEIGGVRAHTARWSDGSVSAYVPEGLPLGQTGVRVISTQGASPEVTLTVEARTAPGEHIAWRFELDSPGVRNAGAVGPDGSVYFNDTLGFLYALDADGGLRWIYCADCFNATGSEGPVAVGADGIVYVAGNPLGPDTNLHAVNPDGTRRWISTDTWTDLVAGPSIGPDGRVYIVNENAGRGLTALDPDTGAIMWASHPVNRAFIERGQYGADLAFGPASKGSEEQRVYTMLDQRPQQVPIPQGADGTVFSFDLDGQPQWETATGGQSIAGGQLQGQPAAGPDGTVYHCSLLPPLAWALYASNPADGSRLWSLYLPPGNTMSAPVVSTDNTVYVVRNTIHLHAVNPSGSVRWTYTTPAGSFTRTPGVTPDARFILCSGSIGDTESFTGYARLVGADGQSRWTVTIPREPDGSGGTVPFVPACRPAFSPDSTRAYLGTTGGGRAGEEHAYIVALDIQPPPACAADFNADGSVGSQDFFDFLGAFFSVDARADINADGSVTSQDFFDFIGVFFAGC